MHLCFPFISTHIEVIFGRSGKIGFFFLTFVEKNIRSRQMENFFGILNSFVFKKCGSSRNETERNPFSYLFCHIETLFNFCLFWNIFFVWNGIVGIVSQFYYSNEIQVFFLYYIKCFFFLDFSPFGCWENWGKIRKTKLFCSNFSRFSILVFLKLFCLRKKNA